MNEAGLSISGMEDALRAGLANGDFADEIDDVDEWLSDEELINAADRGVPSTLVGSGLETLAKNLQSLVQASKTEPDGTVTGSQSNVPSLVIASAEHIADKVSKMKTQPKANAVPVSRPAVKTPRIRTPLKRPITCSERHLEGNHVQTRIIGLVFVRGCRVNNGFYQSRSPPRSCNRLPRMRFLPFRSMNCCSS